MATKHEIKCALKDYINDFMPEIDEDEELTPAINTELTDGLAGVLETVNPNHDYPPTPKPH